MELKSPHLAGCRSGWFRCLTDVKDPASPQAQLSSVKVAEAAPAPPPPKFKSMGKFRRLIWEQLQKAGDPL